LEGEEHSLKKVGFARSASFQKKSIIQNCWSDLFGDLYVNGLFLQVTINDYEKLVICEVSLFALL
jgi:hypothetical protein